MGSRTPLAWAGRTRSAVAQQLPNSPQQGYWKYAEWLVIAMFVVVAIRLTELFPFMNALQLVPLVAYGGGFLLFYHSSPAVRDSILSFGATRLVLAFLATCLITIPFALWPGLAWNNIRTFLPVIVLFLSIVSCAPTRTSLRTVQAGLVSVVALYALYAKTMGNIFADGRLHVVGGMFDANDMAAIMAACLPLAAGFVVRPGRFLRIAAVIASVLFTVVLVASGSRGGVLSFAAGALVFVFGLKGSKRLTGVLVLVIVAFTLWSMSSVGFHARMATLSNLESDYNKSDYTGREQVWKRGIMYFKQHPVLGVGMENFPVAEGNYLGDQGRRGKWSAAHNTFVQAFAELGMIGGVLLLSIYVSAIRSAFKLWRGVRLGTGEALHHPELLASLAAALVAGFFLSHAYFPPLFAILGTVVLADRMRRAEVAAKGIAAQVKPPAKLRRIALAPPGRGGARPARGG